ncbi:phospholipase D family protein [Acidobacteria bacterium AH-259-G07]|nr:phospholipase D family protein [Acidobacteria bacterium AH-259-G07]
MQVDFHIQDPTEPSTLYLFEAIVQALSEAEEVRAIFAFASRDGIETLFSDPEFTGLLERGNCELLVGIDAITNRDALERLQELEDQFPTLTVRIFWNPTNRLFHPKILRFRYPDGRNTVIVGSGNLTPGGLRENFEAYLVVRANPEETVDLTTWDLFLQRFADHIRPIDEEILERAAQNVIRGRRRIREVEPEQQPEQKETEVAIETIEARILVAQIPKAGGRWHQLHLNRVVIDRFFRIQPNSPQRVFLHERMPDGSLNPEQPRPCVFSQTNKNLRIEIAARRGEAYPEQSPPIAVFKELQVRTFEYIVLMPGENGYNEMLNLTRTQPSAGKGLPRAITTESIVQQAWPTCPLI